MAQFIELHTSIGEVVLINVDLIFSVSAESDCCMVSAESGFCYSVLETVAQVRTIMYSIGRD